MAGLGKVLAEPVHDDPSTDHQHHHVAVARGLVHLLCGNAGPRQHRGWLCKCYDLDNTMVF